MLVQRCPPCLLVKGTTASHWEKINVPNVSPSEQYYLCVLVERKQMLPEQREAPSLPLQFNTIRFMHTTHSLFAEWKSVSHIVCQEQFITLLCAVSIDCQGSHIQKRNQHQVFTQ